MKSISSITPQKVYGDRRKDKMNKKIRNAQPASKPTERIVLQLIDPQTGKLVGEEIILAECEVR